ncbi:DUF3624 domain-containing protein [Vibrio sp. SM6]|uniref:DUF3624 domain-containing protein n=1 Tax=Vibrio agarilyticus TaxID=2726741 RepID=A0A7X8TRG3_9VIBR|nr:DUF3624 domain-containing protein [Vibrio agarilyticus]NLS13488.1 DUF3624 domain-containing protein [Vibrio agarilyticus]
MACTDCQHTPFWHKLGRCRRCMWQLSVLSPLSGLLWWHFASEAPRAIETIALLFAWVSFSGLLTLHLLFLWVIWPLKQSSRKARHQP